MPRSRLAPLRYIGCESLGVFEGGGGMRFSMEENHHQGVPVVLVRGDLDAVDAAALRAFVLEAAKGSVQGVIVHLLDISYVEASSLTAVAQMAQDLESMGQHLALICCSDNVQRIFALSGLEPHLNVFGDLDAAAEFLWSFR